MHIAFHLGLYIRVANQYTMHKISPLVKKHGDRWAASLKDKVIQKLIRRHTFLISIK